MAELVLSDTLSVNTPSTGKATVYCDTSGSANLRFKDDLGKDIALAGIANFNTVAQSPTTSIRTYITGSGLAIPKNKLQIGTCFRWTFNLTKTAAGIAASTLDICFGTTGTTTDTARISFTKPAGTAVVDEGVVIIRCVIRTIGATGVAVGEFTMYHNGNTGGHMTIPVACVNTISAGFDMTVVDLIAGVCITSGALDAVTIQIVQAEAWNI